MACNCRERVQGGFTLIEVVIAIFLLMLGSLTVLSLVDASTRNNFRVEQSQVAVNQLEAELERIKQLPFTRGRPDGARRASSSRSGRIPDGGSAAGSSRSRGTEPTCGRSSSTEPRSRRAGPSPGGRSARLRREFQSGDISGHDQPLRGLGERHRAAPMRSARARQDIKRVIVTATLDATAVGGRSRLPGATRPTWSTPT